MIRFPTINVLFNVLVLAAGIFLIFRLPNRLPRSVSALIMIMSLAMPLCMDHAIGVQPIDLYDTNIYPWLTLSELPTWGMYSVFGYLFIYLYDRWNIRGLGIPIYVLGWSLFATAFEGLAVIFDVYNYKGWSLRYSFLVYVVVQLLIVAVFRILMNVFARSRQAK